MQHVSVRGKKVLELQAKGLQIVSVQFSYILMLIYKKYQWIILVFLLFLFVYFMCDANIQKFVYM